MRGAKKKAWREADELHRQCEALRVELDEAWDEVAAERQRAESACRVLARVRLALAASPGEFCSVEGDEVGSPVLVQARVGIDGGLDDLAGLQRSEG